MPIYRRGKAGPWWMRVMMDGKMVRESCHTTDKVFAQEHHDKRVAELWRNVRLGERTKHTVREACVLWLSEHEHKKSYSDDVRYFDFWMKELDRLKITFLEELTPDVMLKIRKREEARTPRNAKDSKQRMAPATVNKKLSFMRAVLNAAVREYQWCDSSILVKLLPESNERVRWITPSDVGRLIDVLPEPYSSMAELSVATGLRQGNVMGLRWENVNLSNATITFADKQMKNGKPFSIPLNQTAIAVIRKQIGVHKEFVFVRKDGYRINGLPTKTWKTALAKAGIEDFHWHDLRHTWASLMRQSGKVGLDILQELGGWKSQRMVQRYAHLSVEHLSDYADVLDSVLSPTGEKVRHLQAVN